MISLVIGIVSGVAIGIAIAFAIFSINRKRRTKQIAHLIEYLESAELGKPRILAPSGEDDLSKLQDEITKTVSALEHMRVQALLAKENYARNLSNIAHQMKTPVAAMTLTVQRLEHNGGTSDLDVISAQISRLQKMQSNLLLMAKLDAGVLEMDIKKSDLLTVLALAVDDVQLLAKEKQVRIEFVNEEQIDIHADEYWLSEAIANVLKNCIEHAPENSRIAIVYRANPLYADVEIQNEGAGFKDAETNRIFERFYTEDPSKHDKTGLGLAFARELIELQNGTIRAFSRTEGGASFKIRLYGHLDVT